MANSTYNDVRSVGRARICNVFRMVGTGATAPTLVEGTGVTLARTGAGVYTCTFDDTFSGFIGATFGIGATTPADVKGHTVFHDDLAAKVLPISLFDSAFAADDLEAAEYITVCAWFRDTSVTT